MSLTGNACRADITSMKYLRMALILAAMSSTGCYGIDSIKNLFTSPSKTDEASDEIRSYLGTWTGPAVSSYPTAQSCGNMEWKITGQNGSQITGEFHGTCANDITLSGTLAATHGQTTIPFAATGAATQGSTTCAFNLTGTGTFQGTSTIQVNYAGTTCLGPVSGSETIKR